MLELRKGLLEQHSETTTKLFPPRIGNNFLDKGERRSSACFFSVAGFFLDIVAQFGARFSKKLRPVFLRFVLGFGIDSLLWAEWQIVHKLLNNQLIVLFHVSPKHLN